MLRLKPFCLCVVMQLSVWMCACALQLKVPLSSAFSICSIFINHHIFASGIEKVWKHVSQVPVGWGARGGADAHTLGPGASGWEGEGRGSPLSPRQVQWRDVICIHLCEGATITASRASTPGRITALVVTVSPSQQNPIRSQLRSIRHGDLEIKLLFFFRKSNICKMCHHV